jgi:hypothetical protein
MFRMLADTGIRMLRALKRLLSKSCINSSGKRCRAALLDEAGIVNVQRTIDAARPATPLFPDIPDTVGGLDIREGALRI